MKQHHHGIIKRTGMICTLLSFENTVKQTNKQTVESLGVPKIGWIITTQCFLFRPNCHFVNIGYDTLLELNLVRNFGSILCQK